MKTLIREDEREPLLLFINISFQYNLDPIIMCFRAQNVQYEYKICS